MPIKIHIIVSEHAKKRLLERFKGGKKEMIQSIADDAWAIGKIPGPSTSRFIFWKWADSEHALCDVRCYKGYFFFFRKDREYTVLITLYKDTGPKKAEAHEPSGKAAFPESRPKRYLRSVGLLKKSK